MFHALYALVASVLVAAFAAQVSGYKNILINHLERSYVRTGLRKNKVDTIQLGVF